MIPGVARKRSTHSSSTSRSDTLEPPRPTLVPSSLAGSRLTIRPGVVQDVRTFAGWGLYGDVGMTTLSSPVDSPSEASREDRMRQRFIGRSWFSRSETSLSFVCWLALAAALAAVVALAGGTQSASASPRAVAATTATTGTGAAKAATPVDETHAPIDFFTSFEDGQPQPTWTDTPETGPGGQPKAANLNGPRVVPTIPGNIPDEVVEVQARGDNPPNESKEKAVDGNLQSKWLDFNPTSWLQGKLSKAETVTDYALTPANDAPGRDPQDWTLQGSNDGSSWTTLNSQSGQDFSERFQTKQYKVDDGKAAPSLYYRLNVDRNHGDNIVQLAELQLSTGITEQPPPPNMRTFVDRGPTSGPNIKSNAGFTGLRALHFAGGHSADGRAYSYNKVFDVDIPVKSASELQYKIFPQLTDGDLQYPSTYSAVDLAFSDGTYLSDLKAQDQQFSELSPQGQGAGKSLYADQWNLETADIGAVAAGKTIKRIIVAYDNPGGSKDTEFGGWIDDLQIAQGPTQPSQRDHLSDWAVTTRGTNASGSFSRGNNFPATAVPHGFNFWSPMTDAGSRSWIYQYQAQNDANNLPELQAFTASHLPSPWMGDRQTFQVMPSTASGVPNANRQARALPFSHDDEIARPYLYGVTFQNGLNTQIAPTDHAAVMQFKFPSDDANLIFDNVNNSSSLTIDQAHDTITGWSDVLNNGASRMFVYATFDQPMTASGMLTSGNRRSTGYARFAAGAARTVTMRIATSLIGVDQAKHNLDLEVGDKAFATVRDEAQAAWDRKLGAITVKGGTPEQLTTLYSNLYRLNLYPNSAFENTGSNTQPDYQHAMQSSDHSPPTSSNTDTHAGAAVVDGKVYVNNGFWDTYRTAWPAYSLLYAKDAGELVDGFVQQYRDGGWISRWSSPGYANIMTGTSSDDAFADAYVKDVGGFNARDAYDAAVKNATVAPPGNPFNSNVGRKGLIESEFLGYTPNRVDEGVSWSLEGFINDYGIANMAAKLAQDHSLTAAQRARYRAENVYFTNRAQDYVHLFDKRVGFFQGKSESGQWTTPPDQYDPRVWKQNGDYTETDGWNFAFHAPQDGQGLANLYGGRDKLAAKLDQFFRTPETAKFSGGYGGTIHEMLEARAVRMGQWGASNQISMHIPYMYDYAGQPYKAAEKVREATRRLYSGSLIGEGYPGDEDNGAMSAWQVFSALGFYPLQAGSPTYAIGSPLFSQATIHLQNGHDLVIDAPENSAKNTYVQGVTVNGQQWSRSYFTQDQLANGGHIEFAEGSQPSAGGTSQGAAPPSITQGNKVPHPMEDAPQPDQGVPAASAGADADKLFDNTSGTETTVSRTAPYVGFDFDATGQVVFYTLTSGSGAATADPSDWILKGSNDGQTWTVLDRRAGESFQWRSQTRPFQVADPGAYRHYRIEFAKPSAVTLAEVEL